MLARCFLFQLVALSFCHGDTGTVAERLKGEFKTAYHYSSQSEVREEPTLDLEPILYLDPFKVTLPRTFHNDLMAENRRAAAAEKALKFSPLTGGLIHSFRNGPREIDLGLWPQLVPIEDGPLKKGTVGIAVDLLRIKW